MGVFFYGMFLDNWYSVGTIILQKNLGYYMVDSPTLSALVVAHNEQDHLDHCLTALSFAHEIVVVLDKCTDNSEVIAKSHTKNIIVGRWEIEGDRRNTGIAACTGDWILEVDADERISPELAQEIQDTMAHPSADYFHIPFLNYVGDTCVRHGWCGSFGVGAVVRLFRKGTKTWGSQRIHPQITYAPDAVKGTPLSNPIHHYVDTDISDMIHRFDRYTTANAHDLASQNKTTTGKNSMVRFVSRFLRSYVSRQGYKEGKMGLLLAFLIGLYPLVSEIKATRILHNKRK